MKSLKLRLAVRVTRTVGMMAALLVLTLGAARGSGITPTNTWANIYSSHSTFAGVPIPAGAYIAIYDPQGTQCGGDFKVAHVGWYGIMPCYGDDSTTGGDEGPLPGERLSFTINGVAATPQPVTRNGTPVPAGTPATWTQNLDLLQIDLIVPPRPPVTITLLTNQLRLDWSFAGADVTAYEVWRSTAPYFAPGDLGAARQTTIAPAGPLTWAEIGGLDDPLVNYTYRVRSLNVLSQTVGMSQAVGEFEFALVR